MPVQLVVLNSQLPQWVDLNDKSPGEVEKLMQLGQRYDKAIVVFSDICNFTEVIQQGDPELLTEMLGKYYTLVRQLVGDHGGIFDKFLGDGVLALFNYPNTSAKPTRPFTDALKFSIQLIKCGKSLFAEYSNSSVAVVDTGTRVGITCGDVWPVNVGGNILQLSFVGHTVNLASRLQHKAEPDGIIMCFNTFRLLQKENSEFTSKLNAKEKRIVKGEMSGILTAINSRVISPSAIKELEV